MNRILASAALLSACVVGCRHTEIRETPVISPQPAPQPTVIERQPVIIEQKPTVIEKPGPTVIERVPSGNTFIERLPDGTIIERRPDGTTIERRPDGTTVERPR
jgi:hypothetical protein